jgi:hypothetical protein
MENKNVVSSDYERQAFPHVAILVFQGAGLALVLFLIAGLWHTFGFTPAFILIAACCVLGTGGYLYTRWEHHRHDIADRKHMRELTNRAIENHHSIEYNPATRALRTISPLTIPNAPVTIKEYNAGAAAALPAPSGALYPVAPPFASVKSLIRPGRLVLGYNTQGAITGDVSDLLSMAFVGKPGTGKSTALLYYLAILLLVEASVFVLDPQGSLYDVADLIPYYGEHNEIYDVLPLIYEEIEERENLFRRNKGQTKNPLLVLVDELPALARYEEKNKPRESVLDLAEKIVTQNRKHNCFCMLTGQSLPANVLPTLTRDNLSSRLVFNSSDMHARMAGLDVDSRKMLLPLLRKAQPGTAILDVSRRPQPDIAALPFTTIDDLRMIVDAGPDLRENSAFPDSDQTFPDTWEAGSEDNHQSGPATGPAGPTVSLKEREQIISIRKSGVPRRDICWTMKKSKRYYDVVRQVLEEEGIE